MLICKKIIITSIIVLGFFTFQKSSFAASTSSPSPTNLRIFYYVPGVNARQSFYLNSKYIDVVAPQVYKINQDGSVTGSVEPQMLTFSLQNGIKVMPLVTETWVSSTASDTLLLSPDIQTNAINALISQAKTYGYWGYQMDFESVNSSYRDQYSAFIQKMYAAFKANNLELSVAVISQVSNNPLDYKNNLWQRAVGVYDYSALAASTDFITLMTYDDPESTGPVSEYSWMKEVLAYSLKYIPAEKISLGIPLYYWTWDDTTGKLIDIGGRKEIEMLLKSTKVTKGYSTTEQAAYMKFKKNGDSYTLWYETAKSIGAKIALVKDYGLQGFSAWALGLEEPDDYLSMGK